LFGVKKKDKIKSTRSFVGKRHHEASIQRNKQELIWSNESRANLEP